MPRSTASPASTFGNSRDHEQHIEAIYLYAAWSRTNVVEGIKYVVKQRKNGVEAATLVAFLRRATRYRTLS